MEEAEEAEEAEEGLPQTEGMKCAHGYRRRGYRAAVQLDPVLGLDCRGSGEGQAQDRLRGRPVGDGVGDPVQIPAQARIKSRPRVSSRAEAARTSGIGSASCRSRRRRGSAPAAAAPGVGALLMREAVLRCHSLPAYRGVRWYGDSFCLLGVQLGQHVVLVLVHHQSNQPPQCNQPHASRLHHAWVE